MSYILDALKRADTERERERGSVPGLHSRNLPGGLPREPQRHPSQAALYAIGFVLLLGLSAAAWWVLRPAAQSTSAPPTATGASAPETAQAAASEPPRHSVASGRVTTASSPDLPILSPPPAAAPSPAPRTERLARPAAAANAISAAAAPPTAPPAPATEAAPAEEAAPVRRFAELPPDFRARLPQVNISGSTYSANPAQRTLIANGKMLLEGEDVAPGLRLESIGRSSAVLSFQGTRYSIGF
jgi:general secretion pathway protein B